MLGCILGDIAGSLYEGNPHRSKEFELLPAESSFTDDTILTLATASALLDGNGFGDSYRDFYSRYPHAGFGGLFQRWARNPDCPAYGSCGNGSAMRVLPVIHFADSIDEVLQLALESALVTHSHPEGIRGAQSVAVAGFLALEGISKPEIRNEIRERFGYDLSRSCEQIRRNYSFDVTCQGSVPESLIAFLESNSVEDAIRNAISLGGDADTMACIAGGLAEAFYGPLDEDITQRVCDKLDTFLLSVIERFTAECQPAQTLQRAVRTRRPIVNDSQVMVADAARGALMGALVGDAVGGTLEFRWPYGDQAVEEAMNLRGGGTFQLAPGQVTDDGELTVSLANALVESGSYDAETAARHYGRWYESRPFDIGMTTATAFGTRPTDGSGESSGMLRRAEQQNIGSKANGALMRIVPVAVAGALQEDDHRIAQAAMLDASLSHANLACQHANAAYCIAVSNLIRSPYETETAINRTGRWIEDNACREVRDWFEESFDDEPCPVAPQIGFVRIAFIHAFHHLIRGTFYVEAIRRTVALGGDSDTNACIVGGLVGAARGIHDIPRRMQLAVLECDTSRGSHPRPEFLHPKQALKMLERFAAG